MRLPRSPAAGGIARNDKKMDFVNKPGAPGTQRELILTLSFVGIYVNWALIRPSNSVGSDLCRRGGRVVEGARLESVYR